jgi:hypothetical protein
VAIPSLNLRNCPLRVGNVWRMLVVQDPRPFCQGEGRCRVSTHLISPPAPLAASRPLPIARGPASCLAPERRGLGPAQSGRARAPPPPERHRGRASASREPRRPGRGLEQRSAPPPRAQPPAAGPAAAAAARSQNTLHARDPRPRVNFIRFGEIRLTGKLQRARINLTCPPRQSLQSRRRRASWQLIGSRPYAPAPPSPPRNSTLSHCPPPPSPASTPLRNPVHPPPPPLFTHTPQTHTVPKQLS